MTPHERATEFLLRIGSTNHHPTYVDMMAAMISEAIAAEREACARIAERMAEPRSNTEPTELGRAIEAKIRVRTANVIATLIRGRGET